MAIVFSPLDRSELAGPFEPRPRTAFIMRQLGGTIDPIDKELIGYTSRALARANFKILTASDIAGSVDFLHKIVDLIRGCGLGIAIFSDKTPAKALANIFYEVGIASVLGKPVQLVMTGTNPAPSDFVRTEWISYSITNKEKLRKDLKRSLAEIEKLGAYFRKIGEIALSGGADLELAFERFKQSILITDDKIARNHLSQLQIRLRNYKPSLDNDLESHHRKLKEAVDHFVGLLPQSDP